VSARFGHIVEGRAECIGLISDEPSNKQKKKKPKNQKPNKPKNYEAKEKSNLK